MLANQTSSSPQRSQASEPRAQWYHVSLWIESERPRKPDMCRRVSVLARSHQDAAARAEVGLRRRWPRLANRLWCTSSVAHILADV